MEGCGRIWQDMVGYGRIWQNMVGYGRIWQNMVEYGRIRQNMVELVISQIGKEVCDRWKKSDSRAFATRAKN